MSQEAQWLCLAIVGMAGMAPVVYHLRHRPLWAATLAGVLILGVGVAASSRSTSMARRSQDQARFLEKTPREERPGGYVGSDQCQACHPGPHASWHESFHRTMTTVAGPDTVKAPFDGRTLEWNGQTYRLERRGEGYWAEMPVETPVPRDGLSPTPAGAAREWQRLTLVTGSHHMQVFWTAGPQGNLQFPFPFAWLIAEQRWVPARDTFLRDPAKGQPRQHWNNNCISCHATGGQPLADPATGRYDTRTGELGISCEACHGPGERHVDRQKNPWNRYTARLRSGLEDTTILNPARLEHRASSQVCGQCHGIRWVPASENYNLNGYSYRPGDDLDRSTPVVRPSRLDLQPALREPLRRNPAFLDEHYWRDGEVRVSGREFNGLVDSPCYERGSMSCLSCHSMHEYADTEDQLAPGRESNEACFQCHEKFRQNLGQHTHHAAGSPGSLCYNCHMPHTTYGLLKAIRSHRITSPSVASTLSTGRPNACNLCHLDQPLAWTAQHLQQWYKQTAPVLDAENRTTSAAVLGALRGDAGLRALVAWHMGWEPARKISGERWLAPYLAQSMADPYAAVRFIAHRSLRSQSAFAGLEFDFTGPESTRTTSLQQAFKIWSESKLAPERTGPAVLLGADGAPDAAAIERLLQQRDTRSIDLQE
jgi:hypothetical protein